MQDQRIVVSVRRSRDHDNLMLQWIDPVTNERRSKSAETHIPAIAEMKRAELEYKLNHSSHKGTIHGNRIRQLRFDHGEMTQQ